MTLDDVVKFRLINQHIINSKCKTAHDVVVSLGAVQAQDYLNSLWAIALRLPNATEADIEQEIEKKKILRTWPMRGTLHFVPAEDARWMLELLTPRVIARSAGNYRQNELDNKVFNKASDLLVRALEGGKGLIREEVYKLFNENKISTAGQRGIHIIGHLSQNRLICIGPRSGKQHTFVLLDEWIPQKKVWDKEEALALLARRYFNSHGPATIKDFSWWTGLTLTEAKSSLEMIKSELRSEVVEGIEYWFKPYLPDLQNIQIPLFLLPAFDEFLIAYQDRTASLGMKETSKVILKNGIFNPVIIKGGKVIGTWKRTFEKNKVVIELKPLSPLNKTVSKGLLKVAEKYSSFCGKTLDTESFNTSTTISVLDQKK